MSVLTRLGGGRRDRSGGSPWTILVMFVGIVVWITILNERFIEPTSLMVFGRKAAPLVILAAGQYLVMVAGELDLSVGSLVGAQVVIAARVMDGDGSLTLQVMLLMLAVGLLVGLVNGLVTTLLKVPSFIVTLGMMMVLYGAVRWWTGGAPTGSLPDNFRTFGRGGISWEPVRQISWAMLIAIAVAIVGVLLMRTSFGRTLVALGDNQQAAHYSGVRVTRTKVIAFMLSSVSATIAAVLIGGFAGVTSQVGDGLEFQVITAVVLGGVALTGGRGHILAAMCGALTLEAIFNLFTQLRWASTLRPTAQGVIIIAAVAYASWRPSLRLPTRWRAAVDPTGSAPHQPVPETP